MHINKLYTTHYTHKELEVFCHAQIDFTQQLCTSNVAFQEPQWPLTPAIEWPQWHLTLAADWPQWASLCLRASAIFLPDLSDKAVLQKYQLSLNNCSQRSHWLGVSSPLANCTTVWAVWCEGKLASFAAMRRQIITAWLCGRAIDLSYCPTQV